MFKALQALVPRDQELPERAWRLTALREFLDGTIYDRLPYAFYEEQETSGARILLSQRRPSVRYGLCRLVVEDAVALLFSEAHFPAIGAGPMIGAISEDERDRISKLSRQLQAIIYETRLNETMMDAAYRGAVGSVAIMFRVLRGRVFYDVMDTPYLTPEWEREAPDTLARVSEKRRVIGSALAAQGYAVSPDRMNAFYWFQREWTPDAENWFLPILCSDPTPPPPQIDASRSRTHSLGFVPVVWIKNLPGGDDIDGVSTFRGGIESGIEIDYQLSQAARGLKYTGDPELVLKDPAIDEGGAVVKGQGNAIVLGEKGEAKYLEINGDGLGAVVQFVHAVRALALETMHGNRAPPDKLAAGTSGRALVLMNQGLVWLADRLRVSYGEGALVSLLKMTMAASQKFPLTFADQKNVTLEQLNIGLRWPRWYPSGAEDRQADALTLQTLIAAGALSRETAVRSLVEDYGIQDVEAEIAAIQRGRDDDEARQIKLAQAMPGGKPPANPSATQE